MVDRVGQHIDDYRLTRLSGEGTFGEVYLGEHLRDRSLAASFKAVLRRSAARVFSRENAALFAGASIYDCTYSTCVDTTNTFGRSA